MAKSCIRRQKTQDIRYLHASALSPLEPRDCRICHHRAPMPSPFGHSLAGLAVAWAADLLPGDRAWRAAPASASWYRRAGNGLTTACAVLAMAPDLDLAFTRHRTYTHSVGAVVIVGLVAAAFASL